jgi:UDP-N-acetylglucosamine 2-epimerase (non-hydrolysing)
MALHVTCQENLILKIMHIVGARPNFPKVAPVYAAMQHHGDRFQQVLVHTGQHYDHQMSQVFFDELGMPEPDEFLNVGSGTHAQQSARILLAFEPVLEQYHPDCVLVVGDVNSTLACALVAAKLGVRVGHVEAGLRSWDRSMPEEINRLLTDQIADLLFTPSRDGDANLLREGVDPAKIHFVGNVMIDTLVRMLPKARTRPVLQQLGLAPRGYLLVTMHRPGNVDEPETLAEISAALQDLARRRQVVFPIHPRTRERMQQAGLEPAGVRLIEPLGYLDFMALTDQAGLVLTDSGGIQEETTYLGVPCLTVRPNTERPVTISQGTNRMVPRRNGVSWQRDDLLAAVAQAPFGERLEGRCPELWDGHAAERIAAVFAQLD